MLTNLIDRDGDFYELICFYKRLFTKVTYSDKLSDITRGVDSSLVYSNLKSESIVSEKVANVIFDYFTAKLELRYPFSIETRTVNFITRLTSGRLIKQGCTSPIHNSALFT